MVWIYTWNCLCKTSPWYSNVEQNTHQYTSVKYTLMHCHLQKYIPISVKYMFFHMQLSSGQNVFWFWQETWKKDLKAFQKYLRKCGRLKKRSFSRQSGSRPALTPTSGEEQARESETNLDRGHAHSLHFSANNAAEVSKRLSPTRTAVWHPLKIDASSEMAEGGGGRYVSEQFGW